MIKRLDHRILQEGVFCLEQRDRDLAGVVASCGPPPLWERKPGYATLVRIILEQQVSLVSARAAYTRLKTELKRVTPEAFLKLGDDRLKEIGFSRQKTRYGRELAAAVVNGSLDLESVDQMEDAGACKALMTVKGIGRWTADIYLLMALGRPDVWPRKDVALATAVQRLKGLATRPDQKTLKALSDGWEPWRSVAARICWHYYLCQRRKGRKKPPGKP